MCVLSTRLRAGMLCAALSAFLFSADSYAGARRVVSVFHIDKSENRNQVHYDVAVDSACRPLRQRPVIAYWREREEGPNVILPLTFFERRAYGVDADSLDVRWQGRGGTVNFALRPLPSRRIAIRTYERDGRCHARAWTHIDGELVRLDSVFVQVGFMTADFIVLHGRDGAGGQRRERLEPR